MNEQNEGSRTGKIVGFDGEAGDSVLGPDRAVVVAAVSVACHVQALWSIRQRLETSQKCSGDRGRETWLGTTLKVHERAHFVHCERTPRDVPCRARSG